MPIEVELPDGAIAEFPDGTSPDVISSTLRRKFGMGQPAQPAPKDPEYGPVRSLGLGTRNALEGLGGMVGAVINPVANFLNRGFGGSGNYFQNPGKTLSDSLGLPTAQNDAERTAGAIIEGGAGILPTLGLGALPAFSRSAPAIASALRDMPKLQAASAMLGGGMQEQARQSGAGLGGQVAAGLAGGALPMLAVNAGRSLLNSAARGAVNPDKARAFAQAGVEAPSLGAVSDSGLVQSIEGGLGQSVTGAGLMREAAERGQQVFNEVVDRAAGKLAQGQDVPDSLEALGRTARDAAERSKLEFQKSAADFEHNFYAPREQLPAKLDNALAFIEEEAARLGQGSASANATRQRLLRELGPMVEDAEGQLMLQGQPITEAELAAQPYLRKLVTEEPGKLNIAAIRQKRRQLQDKIDRPNVAAPGDADSREMKALRGALNKDVEAALTPEDLAQIQQYNQWYAKGSNAREELDRVFFGKKDDTAIARALLSADGSQLEQMRSVIGDQAFGQLRGGALREVTRGRYGPSSDVAARQFSEGRTAMQPEARQALFNGADQNVSDVARALQESRTFTNTSNTANANNLNKIMNLGALGSAGAWMGGIPGALAAVSLPYAAARALTSRKLIDAAVRRALNPKAVQWGNMTANLSIPWIRALMEQLYAQPKGAR